MPLADKTYETQISDDRRTGSVDIDAIADVLNGLRSLHEHGYVHRDLNPKNILRHGDRWKLSNLGAVLPPSGRTVTLTEGTVIYTEQYCSPEQRADFHKAQAPADVYSFGCILHDLFGKPPRTPYSQCSADGSIGMIIEKCTETNASRRPSIAALRGILLETLVDAGGHCKVEDKQAGEWLQKLDSFSTWTDDEFDDFVRFFANLDVNERTQDHGAGWVYGLSTPFLTRIPAEVIGKIAQRTDGNSAAIIEKYCEWVRSTAFLFHYSDLICLRLAAIFDNGTPATKAEAFVALVVLAESHNRWYVMRQMLGRCRNEKAPKEIARRLAIEVKTEEIEMEFRRCVREINWPTESLAH